MKKSNIPFTRIFLGLAFLVSLGVVLAAQNTPPKETDPITVSKDTEAEDIQIVVPPSGVGVPVLGHGSHWIGVQVSPVPDVLLSHFGIEQDGSVEKTGLVVVEQVIPEGPAAQAGVKRGDIILDFSGQKIESLQDLVEKVQDAKATQQTLTVIRDGKPQTLQITPAPRPNEARAFLSHLPHGHPAMRHMPRMPNHGPMPHHPGMKFGPEVWLGNPQQMMREMEEYFRQMQGGVDSEQLLILPEDNENDSVDMSGNIQGSGKRLEISSKTDADGTTKIHVKQVTQNGNDTEEKTWEAGSIDELPDEIRKDVQALFGR